MNPEARFQQQVAEWRKKHRLQEDDPLVTLVELLDLQNQYRLARGRAERPRSTNDIWVQRGFKALSLAFAATGGFFLGRAWYG